MNENSIKLLQSKKDLINEVSPSFCTAKWLQTTLYLQTGHNHSCHHPSPHYISLEEIINPSALSNSNHKKNQRELMRYGFRPDECDYCWKIEDLGDDYFSDRHYKTADEWAWDRFEEISTIDPKADVNPSYLEVSFSNACNFKCVYCSPEVSSSWKEDIDQHGSHYTIPSSNKHIYKNSDHNPYVEAFWKWLPQCYPTLKVFRITGGEPLMTKNTWKILDYIQGHVHVNLELAINSNLGVHPKLISRLIAKTNQLKHSVKKINIYTSLESTGVQAEYTRYGLNYDEWLHNVKTVLDRTTVSVSIMTTINILSLPTFIEFIALVIELRRLYNHDFSYNRIPLSINYLRYPEHLSVLVLPKEIREMYADKILKISESWLKYNSTEKYARLYLEEWNQIKRFCEYLKSDHTINQLDKFKDFVTELDRRRGTSFKDVFPEYNNLWQPTITNITN